MNAQPEIDVLLPIYNDAKGLDKMLGCLAGQTWKHFQVRIADNSEDNAANLAVIGKYQPALNLKYYHHGENIGACRNHQFLLDKADAPYYCILNNDDWINERYFEELMKVAKLHDSDVTVPELHQFFEGELRYIGYHPETSGAIASFLYCLKRSKRFYMLEGIYYGVVKSCKGKPVLSDRLGSANKWILEFALFGTMRTAPGATYFKYYDAATPARHARLNRIPSLTFLHKASGIPEIYFYIFLNALQALGNAAKRKCAPGKARPTSGPN